MTLLIIVVLAILALRLILAYLPTFDYKYKKEIFVVCGAFIMGINFIKILPFGILKIGEQAGLYLLLGFFIQLLFEKMSEGVEHGHIHHHHSAPPTFGFQIITGFKPAFHTRSIAIGSAIAGRTRSFPQVFTWNFSSSFACDIGFGFHSKAVGILNEVGLGWNFIF